MDTPRACAGAGAGFRHQWKRVHGADRPLVWVGEAPIDDFKEAVRGVVTVAIEGEEVPGGDVDWGVESGGAEVEEIAAEGGGGVGEAEAGAGGRGREG